MRQSTRPVAKVSELIGAHDPEMFKLINAFAICIEQRGTGEHLLRLILSGLIRLAQCRIGEEQALMHAVGVDTRHIAKHHMEHRSFIYDIEQFQAQLDVVTCESVSRVTDALLRFLSTWIVNHAMGTDHAMTAQIAAIRCGISPGTAFAMYQALRPVRKPSDPAVGASDNQASWWQLADRLDALALGSKRHNQPRRLAA